MKNHGFSLDIIVEVSQFEIGAVRICNARYQDSLHHVQRMLMIGAGGFMSCVCSTTMLLKMFKEPSMYNLI